MSDNKTLRMSYSTTQWVIVVIRDGVRKYVSLKYGQRHSFEYTVLLNKAKRFNEMHLAFRFMADNQIIGEVLPVEYSLNIHEKERIINE